MTRDHRFLGWARAEEGLALALVLCAGAVLASAANARVLRVGSYHGIRGPYHSIQAAVDAARPGDWILIGPGDYKTRASRRPGGRPDLPAAILITTPNLWIRGMNRNTVVVDGTKPGSARCSRSPAAQNLGPASPSGRLGLNGIMVWKADNVWVQNLTACNFLGGAGDAGNAIWWNGGDGSGTIGGWGFRGAYLSATSTFYGGPRTAAGYGVFSSDWSGGAWNQIYASNFDDSGVYIGACRQVCNQTVSHAWSEFNALGYSGSNSGGRLVVEHSRFDHNELGFVVNSDNDDKPPPQNGTCPNDAISPITHTHSCWVFTHNDVEDNNDADVPGARFGAAGPVGTGVDLTGARNDTVMDNEIESNDAWGVLFVPHPDDGGPCTGGTKDELGPGSCNFDEWGDALLGNLFGHNGSYGNPTNGDIAELNFESGHPTDCYRGNTQQGGGMLETSPSDLQQANPDCDGSPTPANENPMLLSEILCDARLSLTGGSPPCLPSDHYPRRTHVIMHPLPHGLVTMPTPCKGVPTNPWCPRRAASRPRSRREPANLRGRQRHLGR